jgi:tetratricopeptide (TPR) repeat protein
VAARIDNVRERQFELFEGADSLVWIAGEAGPMLEPLLIAHRLGQDLSPHELLHSTFGVMAALFHLGRWQELLGYLDEHVRTFVVDDQSVCPFRPGGLALGAIVLGHRGETDRARSLLATIPRTDAPIGLVEGLQAMAENAIGDPAAARVTAEQVLASGDRNFAEEPAVEIVALLDALAELQDHRSLAGFLPEARRRSGQVALIAPTADRAEARAAAAAGDLSRARDLLGRALEGFERLAVFEAARTRETLAALDRDAATELLRVALTTYEALGAAPHAARVRAALAETNRDVGSRVMSGDQPPR